MYLITFGGLNDTINQIMHAFNYCKKYKRLLVVNSTQSRLEMPIQNYFDMQNNNLYYKSLDEFLLFSEKLTKFPNINLNQLKIFYDIEEKKTLLNNKLYDLNLKKRYEEDIFIYANKRMNGTKTKDFFILFNMKKEIINIIKERYKKLPKDYISVHIRNTDYKSNVPLFVEKNKMFFKDKNIFLATDNKDSKNYFINEVQANIFTFTDLPEYNSDVANGIHKFKTEKKDEINKDSISDLVLLSLGKEIFTSSENSGFSKNAIIMQNNLQCKQKILSQIN